MPRKINATTSNAGATRRFPVYREIALGRGSKRQLVQELDEGDGYIGPCAREMIGRPGFAMAGSPHAVKLARAQLRTLGFTDWVSWGDILKAAAGVGGEKLPPEAAARLWLQLPDQQPGDHFWILMDPIKGRDGEPYVFYL